MHNSSDSKQNKRPLSPHLQIYKPQITSVMSILHRITGVGLTLGLLMFLWFVGAVASGPEAFGVFTSFSGSFLGIIILFGFIIALSYHLCNGIRHLSWDFGYGLDVETVEKTGRIALVATAVLSLLAIIGILF